MSVFFKGFNSFILYLLEIEGNSKKIKGCYFLMFHLLGLCWFHPFACLVGDRVSVWLHFFFGFLSYSFKASLSSKYNYTLINIS